LNCLIWLKSLKGLKRENSYVVYASYRVLNSRYTKFGWNRLRGQRVNLEHTDRQTDTHSLLFIRFHYKYKLVSYCVKE
jgi:hypothetical protein